MSKTWPGFVKVKMLHRQGATVLLPEVLVIGGQGSQWVQPQFLYAPILHFLDDDAQATVWLAALDPSRRRTDGLECEVSFTKNDFRTTPPDRSQIYACTITTDHSPAALSIGRARMRGDGGIDLKLHHHTAHETLKLIHASGHVRGSSWNYQGTRQLGNVTYAYFTSLRSIRDKTDLQRIAMASNGKISLQLDTSPGSRPDLNLDVYRASTTDRKATLSLWLPAEAVSTPHIWKHTGVNGVHYEIAHPWVYRVGLVPGANVGFAGGDAAADAELKRFDYAVMGDCTTIAGLRAPFDEEDTTEVFKIQDLRSSDIFDFWYEHANTPLFAAPNDLQTFAPPTGG